MPIRQQDQIIPGPQGPPGPPGPSGPASTLVGTCRSQDALGMFVSIVGQYGGVPVFHAVDITDTSTTVVGLITAKASDTACTVTTYGAVEFLEPIFEAGKVYYVGFDAQVSTLPTPTTSPLLVQEAGFAVNSLTLFLYLQPPAILIP